MWIFWTWNFVWWISGSVFHGWLCLCNKQQQNPAHGPGETHGPTIFVWFLLPVLLQLSAEKCLLVLFVTYILLQAGGAAWEKR